MICSEVYFDGNEMEGHAIAAHKWGSPEGPAGYSTISDMMEVNVKWYACLVCDIKIRHECEPIRKHLKEAHFLSLENYGATFHSVDAGLKTEIEDEVFDYAAEEKRKVSDFSEESDGEGITVVDDNALSGAGAESDASRKNAT